MGYCGQMSGDGIVGTAYLERYLHMHHRAANSRHWDHRLGGDKWRWTYWHAHSAISPLVAPKVAKHHRKHGLIQQLEISHM